MKQPNVAHLTSCIPTSQVLRRATRYVRRATLKETCNSHHKATPVHASIPIRQSGIGYVFNGAFQVKRPVIDDQKADSHSASKGKFGGMAKHSLSFILINIIVNDTRAGVHIGNHPLVLNREDVVTKQHSAAGKIDGYFAVYVGICNLHKTLKIALKKKARIYRIAQYQSGPEVGLIKMKCRALGLDKYRPLKSAPYHL